MSDAVMVPRGEPMTYEQAETLALQAIHDGGRGMVGSGRNHLHQRVARAILSAYRTALAASTPVGGWEVMAWMDEHHDWDVLSAIKKRDYELLGGTYVDSLSRYNRPLYAAPPPPSVSIGSRPQEAVPTAQAEAAVVVWRSPDEVPSVKAGEYAYRIVAVRRAHNGEVYSFGACYLNAVSLWFEDGNESREITGWNSEEGGDEPIYAPLLRDGDDLVGWCEYPIHSAATPQPADGCSSNEGAGK